MANSKELTNWYIRNIQALDIQVEQLAWSREFFVGSHDLTVRLNSGLGRVFEGTGHHREEETAFLIAASEAIERSVCWKLDISSIGVAVHQSASWASLSAQNEAIEKAAYFNRANIPNLPVYDGVLSHVEGFNRARELFQIRFFELVHCESPALRVVVARSDLPKFNKFIGLGSGSSLLHGCEKAYIELMRNLNVFVEDSKYSRDVESKFIQLNSLKPLQVSNFSDLEEISLGECLGIDIPLFAFRCRATDSIRRFT